MYPILADRLRQQLPLLGWIDLDQGQLQNPDTEYPLPYHAGVALIDFDEADWHDIGQGIQRGNCQVRVTLAVQVLADAYQQSRQRGAALEKLELLADVHKALQHYDGAGAFGALVRTYSRKEVVEQSGVWVYSMGYNCLLTDTGGYDGANLAINGLESNTRPQITLLV